MGMAYVYSHLDNSHTKKSNLQVELSLQKMTLKYGDKTKAILAENKIADRLTQVNTTFTPKLLHPRTPELSRFVLIDQNLQIVHGNITKYIYSILQKIHQQLWFKDCPIRTKPLWKDKFHHLSLWLINEPVDMCLLSINF